MQNCSNGVPNQGMELSTYSQWITSVIEPRAKHPPRGRARCSAASVCSPVDCLRESVDPPGVGVANAPGVNFSVKEIFGFAKVTVRFFESHSFCQVPLQLSCGHMCQIWTWYSAGNRCLNDSEELGKLRDGRNWLSNPTPWAQPVCTGFNVDSA